MITIGLTGKIASGKSEVAKLLASKGVAVIDADKLAHETYGPNTGGFAKVVDVFGSEIISSDGFINREKLGDIVFNDKDSLQKLTNIVWPLTKEKIRKLQQELLQKVIQAAVLDAAVLIKAGWQDLVDEIWLVTASDEAILERLKDRGFSYEDAEKRILPIENGSPDVTIENNSSLEQLSSQVDLKWEEFKIRNNL